VAYDEALAHRIRTETDGRLVFTERKMFGGLAFMLNGNMTVGIIGDELMVRVGPAAYEECLALPHARVMDFTGRTSKGMVYVGTDGIAEDDDLAAWVDRGVAYAGSLPPK
jgi:TfoX/Sxy family transcriptional regulator of competence genes